MPARCPLICLLLFGVCPAPAAQAIFNVKDYGAAGRRSLDARPAIQKALDAAAAAGGGTVYLPPGAYTSGTLHLRSHVRLLIDSGATLFASLDSTAFDQAALLYGEGLDNITIEGRGALDGQAEYVWQDNGDFDDAYIRENMLLAKAFRKPLMRSFPKGFPKERMYPHLVLLLHCNDVRIAGLSFLRSRSWTINPYACRRLTIDGVYIQSSLKEAVWADGIDPDGCQDVRISNSTIETGDDAIVFYSSNIWGPPLPCENITVTNCRLSSASSAIKFCDGNMNCIRHVTVDNTVVTDSNRGIAFMVFDGGYVSDVVLSNLTIQCRRHDWFWWGDGDPIHFNIKRRSEVDGTPRANEPPAGSIRNVMIQNVVARGMGSSLINGHPDSWLDGVSFDNIKLIVSSDPASPLQKTVNAFDVRYARNLRIKNVDILWDLPSSEKWRSPLHLEDVQDVELDGLRARPASAGAPVVALSNVERATIRNSDAAPGTQVFLDVAGPRSHTIRLVNSDLGAAQVPYRLAPGSRPAPLSARSHSFSILPAAKSSPSARIDPCAATPHRPLRFRRALHRRMVQPKSPQRRRLLLPSRIAPGQRCPPRRRTRSHRRRSAVLYDRLPGSLPGHGRPSSPAIPPEVYVLMKPSLLALCFAFASAGLYAQKPAWQPSPGHTQVPIWPGTPPDAQFGPPPNTETAQPGEVGSVSRPTITVYSPKGKNTGAAVVVFPGGGYSVLAIDLEGTEVCDWLNPLGITCVLLKYRVPHTGPQWNDRCRCQLNPKAPMALQDAQRTMGLLRFHAAEYHIHPHKIGVLGFSAGGHLSADISTHFDKRLYPPVDAADKESCRPDFAVVLYPGHLWSSSGNFHLNPGVPVTRRTPPTFLVQAQNDPVDSINNSLVYYIALKNAGVPVEMHLYADGKHAFGLRRTSFPITRWPALVETWLRTIGML